MKHFLNQAYDKLGIYYTPENIIFYINGNTKDT